MNDKKIMNEFIDMNLDWADKKKVDTIVFIGHLTSLLCLVMSHAGFTSDQVEKALKAISDNYKQFLSDIND